MRHRERAERFLAQHWPLQDIPLFSKCRAEFIKALAVEFALIAGTNNHDSHGSDLQITRQRDVPTLLGVAPMTIYRWRQNDPTFPKPIRLGKQSVGYVTSELRAWAESRRMTQADSAAMAPHTANGEPVIRRPDLCQQADRP